MLAWVRWFHHCPIFTSTDHWTSNPYACTVNCTSVWEMVPCCHAIIDDWRDWWTVSKHAVHTLFSFKTLLGFGLKHYVIQLWCIRTIFHYQFLHSGSSSRRIDDVRLPYTYSTDITTLLYSFNLPSLHCTFYAPTYYLHLEQQFSTSYFQNISNRYHMHVFLL